MKTNCKKCKGEGCPDCCLYCGRTSGVSGGKQKKCYEHRPEEEKSQ